MTARCSPSCSRRRGSPGRRRRVRASRKDSSHGEVEDDASETVARSYGEGVDGNRRNRARRGPAVVRESRTKTTNRATPARFRR